MGMDRAAQLTTASDFPHHMTDRSYQPRRPFSPPRLFHSVTHMAETSNRPIVLASGSEIRASLLRSAALTVETVVARIDEEAIRAALEHDGATPRDVADALAEMKARKVAAGRPGTIVIGCDQVLDHAGAILGKPQTRAAAREQLLALRGRTHRLLSAVVVVSDSAPVWRHVGTARLTMREFTEAYLDGYLDRNWPAIGQCVGSYRLEAEGVRLFSRIEGDYFTILGLPLIELLTWLAIRGDIAA